MKKILLALALLTSAAVPAMAQDAPPSQAACDGAVIVAKRNQARNELSPPIVKYTLERCYAASATQELEVIGRQGVSEQGADDVDSKAAIRKKYPRKAKACDPHGTLSADDLLDCVDGN